MLEKRWDARRGAVAIVAALLAWTSPAAAQGPAAPAADSTREMAMVEEQPALLNRREVVRVIHDNYPPALWHAQVQGTVMLKFRITAAGVPDPASMEVLDATRDGFAEAAAASARAMRFAPARLDGRAVAVWVTLPISFIYDPRQPPPRRREPAPAQR